MKRQWKTSEKLNRIRFLKSNLVKICLKNNAARLPQVFILKELFLFSKSKVKNEKVAENKFTAAGRQYLTTYSFYKGLPRAMQSVKTQIAYSAP